MKSSELSGAFYSVLALYLPFSMLAAVVLSAGTLIRSFFPAFSPPLLAMLLPAALSGLAGSGYYALTRGVKSSRSAASIRGGVIVLAAAYPAASLLRLGVPFSLRFLPGFANVLAPLCALYAWTQAISLRELFAFRELLETYTENYTGENLRQHILEDAPLLSALGEGIRKNRRGYSFQMFLTAALAITRAALKIPPSVPEFILFCLVFLNGSCFFGLLGLFGQEHGYAGEGLAASPRDRARRIGSIVLVSAAAALGAALLAPGKSILPLSLITRLFALLASLLTSVLARLPRPEPRDAPPPELPEMAPPSMERPAFLGVIEPGEPWPVWQWLQYGALGAAVLLFLWFMLKPLAGMGRSSGSLTEKLRGLILRWYRNIRAFVSSFWGSFGEKEGGIAMSQDELRRISGGLLAASSQRKRKELWGSVTLFARLIVWGGAARGVAWKPVYGPGEYCALLERSFREFPKAGGSADAPDQGISAAIIRCGELFEKALYGPAAPGREEQGEFKRLIETITA
jgi:hypothetical protein